jgi:hypothetical protein
MAFPNGRPESCWTQHHVGVMRQAGAAHVFAASGHINSSRTFLLDRLTLGPRDDSVNRLWYRQLRARVGRS